MSFEKAAQTTKLTTTKVPKPSSSHGCAQTPLDHQKSWTKGLVENLIIPQLDLHAQCRTTHFNRQQLSTRKANLFQRLHCHDADWGNDSAQQTSLLTPLSTLPVSGLHYPYWLTFYFKTVRLFWKSYLPILSLLCCLISAAREKLVLYSYLQYPSHKKLIL